MSRLPIRARVTVAFALAMAAVLAGTGLYLYTQLGSHLSQALDGQLQLRAEDLSVLVGHSSASLSNDSGGRFIERGESYAQLVDGRGRVVQATQPLGRGPILSAAELSAALRGPVYASRPTLPGLDEPSRLLATPLRRGGRRLVLVVGATSQNRAETLASFRRELLVAGPIALVLASLVGYLLAGISLRQVDAMRRRAATISAETPGERLPVPRTHDEIERLGETLNGMLARLEAALQRERNFVADAGHELRTPLALLRTELELALRHGGSAEELREAVRRSIEETDRLGQLAEDLLLIAGADQGKLPLRTEQLVAGDLLKSVVNRFAWRAEEAGRPLVAEAPPDLQIVGDGRRLEQALGNLVDNALRYGEGTVTLGVVTVDSRAELHVTDEGAGFDERFVARAFERFTRSDETRASGGAGLGLSIVQTIAEAHGGNARAGRAESGGADVWLVLPH